MSKLIMIKKLQAALSLVCILLAVVLAPSSISAKEYDGFTIPAAPVLPDKEIHPALWFSAEDVDEIRMRKDQDEHAAKWWEQIISSPYLTNEMPDVPARDADKKTVHKYYGDIPQFAAYNAFMYQMEEDAGKKALYLDRAIAALIRAFDGFVYEINPKEKSTAADEIYHAVWAQNYAAAYDWVQPALTPEQDQAIRVRLRTEAVYIHENLMSWASRPHNHLSKPAWGLGSLALALSDEPEAKDWLARAIKASNMNTSLFFSGDGIYREGGMYYIFSLINFLPFLYHYQNVSDVNAFEHFQPAFEWPLIIRNGRGWMHNIEDSFIRPTASHMVAGVYKNTPTDFHETASLGSVLQHTFLNTYFGPFDRAEEVTGFNYSGASWDYAKPLIEYLCYDPTVEPAAPTSSPTIFMNGGQTVFRNDWSFNDPAHRYLLFQGVAEANNHQHFDHLSFIIQAENQMMASDSGYTRKSYGEKIRREWYLTARAHNVVTLNGSAPQDVEENVTPISRHRIDSDFFDFEEKEAVYPNGGKLRRAVAFPGQEYFVVADILETPEPAEAELILHGGRAKLSRDGDYQLWQYSDDTYGPAAKLSSWILSQGANFSEHMGEITYIKGDWKEFPYVTATLKTEGTNFLQILFPHADDVAAPVLENLSSDRYLAAKVVHNETTDIFLVQSNTREVAPPNIITDATFVYIRIAGDNTHIAVRNATTLSFNGKPVLTAPEPVTLTADLGDIPGAVVSEDSATEYQLNTF
jgi:hypothetical protein